MPSTRLAADEAAFYTAQSVFSAPNDLAHLYAGLPGDPARLARTARELLIHRSEGEVFQYAIPRERLHDDAETRYIDDILRLIAERDPAPLTERREPGRRFVGVCRDFALLYCSFLRHAGIPARVRIGFADYFGPGGFHGDHVVTEYWAGERGWRLADSQLADPLLIDRWGIDFDPMDVPRDRFLVAPKAWRAIRTGGADPRTFGLHPPEEGPMWGEWFVAHDTRVDLAALNRVETLLWDTWGAGASLTDADRELHDRVSLVAGDDVVFDAARELFAADEGLLTPETVVSLASFSGPAEVRLRRQPDGPGGRVLSR